MLVQYGQSSWALSKIQFCTQAAKSIQGDPKEKVTLKLFGKSFQKEGYTELLQLSAEVYIANILFTTSCTVTLSLEAGLKKLEMGSNMGSNLQFILSFILI